jgi:hypothetical protein
MTQENANAGKDGKDGKEAQEPVIEIKDTPEPVKEVPTSEELNGALTPAEIEAGKKHGLVTEKKPDAKPGDEDKGKEKDPPAPAKKEEIKTAIDENLSPEAESLKLKTFNANEKALYWSMKKEREKRQRAEAERDLSASKVKAYEEMLARGNPPAAPAKPEGKDDLDKLFDEEGNEITDDTPLTLGQLKKLQAEQDKQKKAQDDEANQKQKDKEKIAVDNLNKLNEQEKEAKAKYADYDDVLNLATETLDLVVNLHSKDADKRVDAEQQLNELFENDATKIKQAKRLAASFTRALINGGVDESGDKAADIAYELGVLNPKYSAVADGAPGSAPGEGSDDAARAIANAKKRATSASLAGAGKKTVPLSQITPEMVVKMSTEEYRKLPQEVKDRLLGKKT